MKKSPPGAIVTCRAVKSIMLCDITFQRIVGTLKMGDVGLVCAVHDYKDKTYCMVLTPCGYGWVAARFLVVL